MKDNKIQNIHARLPVIVTSHYKDISDTIYSETTTISATGLSLKSQIKLDINLGLSLTLFLTDDISNYVANNVGFINCKGKVISNSRDTQSPQDSYLIGISIIDMKDEDSLILTKFLNSTNYSKHASFVNKRRDKRVAAALPVIILKNSFNINETEYAQIKNISESGAYFMSNKKFTINEEVPLRIFLPLTQDELNKKIDTILSCNARITRLEMIKGEKNTNIPILGMGLEFINMLEEEKSRLKDFINLSA